MNERWPIKCFRHVFRHIFCKSSILFSGQKSFPTVFSSSMKKKICFFFPFRFSFECMFAIFLEFFSCFISKQDTNTCLCQLSSCAEKERLIRFFFNIAKNKWWFFFCFLLVKLHIALKMLSIPRILGHMC